MARRAAPIAALFLMLTAPALVSGQAGGPGFLFKRPILSIGVRAGYSMPRAHGQLFEFARDEFIPLGGDTLRSLSFDSPYLAGELSVRPWERWDIALGVAWTRSRQLSEYRRWVDNSGDPIQNETTFQVVSFTVGTKYYLRDRGRSVGSLAWIPNSLTPYVGGGLGVSWYDFTQSGDFFDSSTFIIYADELRTSGDGLGFYGAAGADYVFAKRVALTVEARYSFSNAGVVGSYYDFDNIDLAGLKLLVGLGLHL